MKLGIGSYSYMWSVGFPGAEPLAPLGAIDILKLAQDLEVGVVQFGPNLRLSEIDAFQLASVDRYAREAGIQVEIGTRGLDHQHLLSQLKLASQLGARLLRTVPESVSGATPSLEEMEIALRDIEPELRAMGVRLALENSLVPCQSLADVIDKLASPWIGVTLDTVNSLAIGEGTKQVVSALARHTMCLHVKDFIVQREWHRMGFRVEGRAAGTGQMDLPWILTQLQTANANANAILELWPPEQSSLPATIALEQSWARESVGYLRRHISD